MLNKFLPWILLGITVFVLLVIGIKSCNSIPDVNPYNMQINRLETELLIEKRKTDSLDQKVKYWEQLYIEESKKPKKIIIRTNEKSDSIISLPFDSSVSFFNKWTKQPVPQIPE